MLSVCPSTRASPTKGDSRGGEAAADCHGGGQEGAVLGPRGRPRESPRFLCCVNVDDPRDRIRAVLGGQGPRAVFDALDLSSGMSSGDRSVWRRGVRDGARRRRVRALVRGGAVFSEMSSVRNLCGREISSPDTEERRREGRAGGRFCRGASMLVVPAGGRVVAHRQHALHDGRRAVRLSGKMLRSRK